MVSSLSYLYDDSPYNWKDAIGIEIGPSDILLMEFSETNIKTWISN